MAWVMTGIRSGRVAARWWRVVLARSPGSGGGAGLAVAVQVGARGGEGLAESGVEGAEAGGVGEVSIHARL